MSTESFPSIKRTSRTPSPIKARLRRLFGSRSDDENREPWYAGIFEPPNDDRHRSSRSVKRSKSVMGSVRSRFSTTIGHPRRKTFEGPRSIQAPRRGSASVQTSLDIFEFPSTRARPHTPIPDAPQVSSLELSPRSTCVSSATTQYPGHEVKRLVDANLGPHVAIDEMGNQASTLKDKLRRNSAKSSGSRSKSSKSSSPLDAQGSVSIPSTSSHGSLVEVQHNTKLSKSDTRMQSQQASTSRAAGRPAMEVQINTKLPETDLRMPFVPQPQQASGTKLSETTPPMSSVPTSQQASKTQQAETNYTTPSAPPAQQSSDTHPAFRPAAPRPPAEPARPGGLGADKEDREDCVWIRSPTNEVVPISRKDFMAEGGDVPFLETWQINNRRTYMADKAYELEAETQARSSVSAASRVADLNAGAATRPDRDSTDFPTPADDDVARAAIYDSIHSHVADYPSPETRSSLDRSFRGETSATNRSPNGIMTTFETVDGVTSPVRWRQNPRFLLTGMQPQWRRLPTVRMVGTAVDHDPTTMAHANQAMLAMIGRARQPELTARSVAAAAVGNSAGASTTQSVGSVAEGKRPHTGDWGSGADLEWTEEGRGDATLAMHYVERSLD